MERLRENEDSLYAAWAQFSLTSDIKDFHAYIDLLITALDEKYRRTDEGTFNAETSLPSGFLRSVAQQLRNINLQIVPLDSIEILERQLQSHAAFVLKVLDALMSIARNGSDVITQLTNACALNGALLNIMQKTIDFMCMQSKHNQDADEKLVQIVVACCKYFERLYDPAFRWHRKLDHSALYQHATTSSNTISAVTVDQNSSPTSSSKAGQLSAEVLPLLHEMLMKIPNLFDETIFSRSDYERITTSALHLLGSILYGSVYNALQVATPAILDALLWLMKHRLKVIERSDCSDELIVVDLMCLVRMVHVLHAAPSADLRQLEVDAHIEEYLRFMSDLPFDSGRGQNLKQILLDCIAVMLNCPNRHSLQQIMLLNCNAFVILRSELCRFLSVLSTSSLIACDEKPTPSCSDADSRQLLLAVYIRVLTQLMQHSTNAKQYFDSQVGFPLLMQLLRPGANGLNFLSENVVSAVVDMVFASPADATKTFVKEQKSQQHRNLENPKAAVMLIGLLKYMDHNNPQQIWAIEQIYRHAELSVICRAHFAANNMLTTILTTLEEDLFSAASDDERVTLMPAEAVRLLHRFITLLATCSINSVELHTILCSINRSVNALRQEDSKHIPERFQLIRRHAHCLLQCIVQITSSSKSIPRRYFDISRDFDGILVNSVGKLLCSGSNQAFVFHCWLCLDASQQQQQSDTKKSRRSLFCFTDPTGAGCEAFLSCPDDELFVVCRTKQKFLILPVKLTNLTSLLASNASNETNSSSTLCDGRWHSLTIVYNMAASVSSTLRKNSNRLFALPSSIASAVMSTASMGSASATSVNVYIDGQSACDTAIMVRNNSKLPESFSRCLIGAAATHYHMSASAAIEAASAGKMTTSYEGQVINIPLGTEDDIWGVSVALHGMLGPVCVFSEILSPTLIKSLHDAGPDMRTLSRKVTESLQGSNRFYLHFSPYACGDGCAELPSVSNDKGGGDVGSVTLPVESASSGVVCLNLAAGHSSPVDNGSNCFAKFIGRVGRVDSIYDSINNVGGIRCLLPLVQTCDVLLDDESCDSNTGSEKCEENYDVKNPLACFFTALRNILSNPAVEDVDDLTGIFSTVAVLLADQKQYCNKQFFTVDVLFAVQILAEFLLFESPPSVSQHPNALCDDFLRYILFNFDLWSNEADFTVQIGHVQFLRKIMRDQRKLFCRQYGYNVQYLLDVVRRYYMSSELIAATNSSENLAEIDKPAQPTLPDDDSRLIRASLFSTIREIVSRDTHASDVRALVGFILGVVSYNTSGGVVACEELIDSCIDMMQPANLRNLSDQFLLHMFEPDNAELLFYIITLKAADSNRSLKAAASSSLDSNYDNFQGTKAHRLSILKEKVLQLIDLLLATPKVYEKSKITLRLDDAGGITGLMMFVNGSGSENELSECMMLMFVNQLLAMQEKSADNEGDCYTHLLALTNKLHHVRSIDTKLEIARRFLTSLFLRPRAAHQLARISGWCLSLLGLLVETPIRASSFSSKSPRATASSESNLIDFESPAVDSVDDSASLKSTASEFESVLTQNAPVSRTNSNVSTTSTLDNGGDMPPLRIVDDDEFSTEDAVATPEPFELVGAASVDGNNAVLSDSLLTTQLGARSLLTLPLSSSSSIKADLAATTDRPRKSSHDATALAELVAIVVNIIFTGIWKGLDGFDRPSWLKRAQAFTSVDIISLSNVLYADRQHIKRSVLEMLITAVTMDFQNSSAKPTLNSEQNADQYTAIFENALSVLKLCYDFCCDGSLLDDKTGDSSKLQNFVEKFLHLCEIVLSSPKSKVKIKVVDRLDLVTMHRQVLLKCIQSERLELCAFGAARLHGVITASSSSPYSSAIRVREAEEAAHLLFCLTEQLVLDLEMGNWERYAMCAPLWKNMLQQCGALLNADHYLFKVPINHSGEEFLNALQTYLMLQQQPKTPTTSAAAVAAGSEWKAFMKCIVETLYNKFKARYIVQRREKMSTFWIECTESTVEGLHLRNRLFGEAKLRCQVRIIRRAMHRQRAEQARFAQTLERRENDRKAVLRRWKRQNSSYIMSSRGPWGRSASENDEIVGFELMQFENILRIRPCVDKCWDFDRELFIKAAEIRDNTHVSQNLMTSAEQQLLLKRAAVKKHRPLTDVDADEDWDVIISAAAAERESAENNDVVQEPVEQDTEEFLSTFFAPSVLAPSLPPTSVTSQLTSVAPSFFNGQQVKIILREQCTRVTPAFVVDGILRLTTRAVCFTPTKLTGGSAAGDDAAQNSSTLLPIEEMAIYVRLDALRELHLRRYNLRRSAVEIFLTNQTNFFLNFADGTTRNKVCSRVINLKPPNMVYYKARSPAALLKASGITQRWMQREIGNFEYLMALNTIAGRSFNDLAQYPVFPWVVKKFDVDVLDIDDPDTFRDLSRPMGVQNYAQHAAEVRSKFDGFDDPEIPPFHYGQHYSTPATVIHYLLRLEPFSTLHVALQSGRWDLADRQFYDIASTWRLLYDNPNEVKELTPEFFALPEFLLNVNRYDLGKLQGRSAAPIGDVILPRWARTPEEFIYQHRRALECEFVSARLHHWIDLIFGYKQQGPAAVDALNVFYYCTYEGNVDLDAIEDPVQRKALEGMINNFGQTPSQLLQEPHPRRMSYEEATHRALKAPDKSLNLFNYLRHLQLSACVDAQANNDACVFVGLARLDSSLSSSASNAVSASLLSPAAAPALTNSRSLFVQATTMATSFMGENTVITVGASGAVGIHAWQPNLSNNSGSNAVMAAGAVAASQVFWEFDVSVNNKGLRNIAGPFHPALISSSESSSSLRPMNSNLFVLSYDGKLLVSAGHWDNSIRVFNIYRSKTIAHLQQHFDTVTCLSIDTFGLHLISGSCDGQVFIWHISQQPGEIGTATAFGGVYKKPLHSLSGHVGTGVVAVAINTELDTALSVGEDGKIVVSSVEHGNYKRTLEPFNDFNNNDANRKLKAGRVEFVSISACTAHIYVAANRATFAACTDSQEEVSTAAILFVYSINGKFLYHRTFFTSAAHSQITCMKCAPCADYCLLAVEEKTFTAAVKKEARLGPRMRRGGGGAMSRSTSFAPSSQSVLHVVEWFNLNIAAAVPLAARGLSIEVARGNSHILVGLQTGRLALFAAHLGSNNHGSQNSAANALSAITENSNNKMISRAVNKLISVGF